MSLRFYRQLPTLLGEQQTGHAGLMGRVSLLFALSRVLLSPLGDPVSSNPLYFYNFVE